MNMDICDFDILSATTFDLLKSTKFCSVCVLVPGLTERKPDINRGDAVTTAVIYQNTRGKTKQKHAVGIVHGVFNDVKRAEKYVRIVYRKQFYVELESAQKKKGKAESKSSVNLRWHAQDDGLRLMLEAINRVQQFITSGKEVERWSQFLFPSGSP